MPKAPIVVHLAPPAWLSSPTLSLFKCLRENWKRYFIPVWKQKTFLTQPDLAQKHCPWTSVDCDAAYVLLHYEIRCTYTSPSLIIIAACVKTWPHHHILIESFSVHSGLFDCHSRNRFGSDGSFPTNVPVSHDSEPAWTIPQPCNYLNYTAQLFFGAIGYTCASPAMKHLLWKKKPKKHLHTCIFMWLSSQIRMWRYYNG